MSNDDNVGAYIDNYCEHDKSSINLLYLPEYWVNFMIKVAELSLRMHSIDNFYYKRSIKVLDALVENTPTESDGVIRGLINDKESCYMDSVLFCLFAIDSPFIMENMLNAKLEKQTNLRFLKCGDTPESDLENRCYVQRNLVDIYNSLRGIGKNQVRTCRNLRKAFANCKHSENFHLGGEKDAGEFLEYLFSIFPGVRKVISKDIAYNMTNTPEVIDVTNNVNDIPIRNVFYLDLIKGGNSIIDLSNFLTNTYVLNKYSNIHMSNIVIQTPYYIFCLNRQSTEEFISRGVLPTKYITTNNTEKLEYFASVVWDNNHYIAYIRFGLVWYLYNDMSSDITKIGTYMDLLHAKPSVIHNGTLHFYANMDT